MIFLFIVFLTFGDTLARTEPNYDKGNEPYSKTFFQSFFLNWSSFGKLFENQENKKQPNNVNKKIGVVYDDDEEYYDEESESVLFPACEGLDNCQESDSVVVCGETVRSGRIVNGSDATAGSYPWAVGIQFGTKLYCGGSLITNEFILTAAHCLKGINHSKIRLVLGDHDRRTTSSRQLTRTAHQVFLHPEFEKKTFNNDIALIKLNQKVEFSPFIRPICLPTTDRSYNGQDTIVVGWGKTGEGGDPANILQYVTVPIIPQKKCRKDTMYRAKEITENMMCAGFTEGKVDACQGDSGGPMIWRSLDNKAFTQIGIVSWGQGCARSGYPGVYTRLGRYLHWIIRIVESNGSCFCSE